MKSNVLSFVVATVSTAVIASACCGPVPIEGPAADEHLTVAVALSVDDVKEPVCDATVTAYLLEGALYDEPNEEAPIELKPEILEGECVYRATRDGGTYEIRVSHPDHGEATVLGVAPDFDGASPECGRSYSGVDSVDEVVTLEG